MSTWDEGDVATLSLAVSPSGPTTSATVAVRGPDGALRPCTPSPNPERSEWTTTVLVDEPGQWDVRWTVTGEGAGTEALTFGVRPSSATRPTAYATTADLARWLGDAPPAQSPRMLADASRVVDSVLVGARYAVDDEGLPTGDLVRAALRDATCAQVAAQGDPDGADDDDDRWTSVSIGSVSLTDNRARPAAPDPTEPAREAIEVLRVAGLVPIRPYVVG